MTEDFAIPTPQPAANQPVAEAPAATTTVSTAARPSSAPARLRLGLVVSALVCLNVFMAYWRGTHMFNFSDSGYLLENLHRIYDGQVPYRDFFLSLPPA